MNKNFFFSNNNLNWRNLLIFKVIKSKFLLNKEQVIKIQTTKPKTALRKKSLSYNLYMHYNNLFYSCRVLANYIVWNAINAQVGYFPSKFIEASFLLSKVESGIASVDPRWQRCVSKVNSAFGYASSALYVLDHFAKESRSKVDNC